VRKLAHPAEYALLAILLLRALRHPRRSIYASAASALALSALYATSDEIHQTFTVSRVGAVTDVVLDTIGAAIGVTMAAAWQARLNSDR
jgi:VanZ family protein